MRRYIPKREMQEYVGQHTIEVGQQINVNHEECPDGADTKKRLYIKRVSSGHLFFCQHCKSTGILRDEGMPYGLHTGKFTVCGEYEELHKVKISFSQWKAIARAPTHPLKDSPLEVKLWWYSYGLTDEDADNYGVFYSEQNSRLFLPVNDIKATARFIAGTPIKAGTALQNSKYIEYAAEKDAPVPVLLTSPNVPLFVVEDVVSAYKLHKAGANVLPLWGTSIGEREIQEASKFHTVVVWLDPDTAGITASVAVKKQLEPFCKKVYSHTWGGEPQPKEESLTHLQHVVTCYKGTIPE